MFCSLLVAVFVVSCTVAKHANIVGSEQSGPRATQHHTDLYPVIQQKYFLNSWSGTESCDGKTQTPSFITLNSKDSASVFISGLFNSTGTLEGTIRWYMIIIKPQPIQTMPKGNTIEGVLVLSNDHQSLNGYFRKQLNGQVDSCTAVYQLAK